MKDKFVLGILTFTFVVSSSVAQTLWVPSGSVGSSSANVGIGTSAPNSMLHIGGTKQELRIDYNGTNNHYGAMRWAGLQLGNNGANRIIAGRSISGGSLEFYVNNTNNAVDYSQTPDGTLALALASNGQVGIGTTTPTHKLEVVGDFKAAGRSRVKLVRYNYGGVGDTVAIGSFTSDGVGRNIKVLLEGHNGGVVDVHSYEFNEVSYLGTSTQWLEISVGGNSVSHQGNPGYALDLYRPDISSSTGVLYLRIRTKRTIGAGYVKIVLEYDADSTFSPLADNGTVSAAFNSGSAPGSGGIDGYYGAVEWNFPVSNGHGWNAANGLGLYIKNNGNVGIGTTNPSHKLAVKGTIRANEVIVDTGWSDYVFAEDYDLATLSEVEAHIEQNGHLPDVPSAAEVAINGISLGEMQSLLLAKIEELTLHQIAQEKQQSHLLSRISNLESENQVLRGMIIR